MDSSSSSSLIYYLIIVFLSPLLIVPPRTVKEASGISIITQFSDLIFATNS